MASSNSMTRRGVLAVSGAAAASAALPAHAAPELSTRAVQTPKGPTTWAKAGYDDLVSLIGERFRVTSPTGASGVLKLVALEAASSGPARPLALGRQEGVVALFDSPDKDFFVGSEAEVYRVSHSRLGSADLFIGRSPLKQGGDLVEMVLN